MQVNYSYTHSKCNHCFFGFDVRFKNVSHISRDDVPRKSVTSIFSH